MKDDYRIAVSIPQAMYDRIKDAAKEMGLTLSSYVRLILYTHYKQIDNTAKPIIIKDNTRE